MAVELLPPGAYAGFLERVSEGADALTHRAGIHFAGAPDVDSYCKVYLPSQSPRGLINEIVGYVLARCVGFDVPAYAAVLCASVADLGHAYPDHDWNDIDGGLYPVWCVASMDGKSAKQLYYPDSTVRMRKDLAAWRHLPAAVAFDAWIANVDRNIGNIIRLGKGKYGLIDHGQICTGPAWSAGGFDVSDYSHPNKLASAAWGGQVAPAMTSAICAAADLHAEAYGYAYLLVDHWIEMLTNPQDGAAVLEFLRYRAHNTAPLRTAFGSLI